MHGIGYSLLQLYLGAAEDDICMNDRRKSELIIGMFDAERFWRDPNLAKLPSVHDPEMENVVMAMDELLFPFCEGQDRLITRYRMNVCHKAYLHEIGFKFFSNSTDLESPDGGSAGRTANIFDLLTSADRVEDMDPYWLKGARLSPLPSFRGGSYCSALRAGTGLSSCRDGSEGQLEAVFNRIEPSPRSSM